MRTWPRGSGALGATLSDARGNPLNDRPRHLQATPRQEFRPDIFADPVYWADEPIEED